MINGMVVRDGAPVEGAYVRLIGPSGEFVSERRTRGDGCFRFHVEGPGWKLVAFGPGVDRVEQEVPPGEEQLVVDISGREGP